MTKYAVLIVFEHEEMPLPELDTKIGTLILVEGKLPENIVDYKILATEDS